MPRIPYPDPASLSESVREHLGPAPANVSRMMTAASEPVYRALGALGQAFINGSPLPPRLREVAILRVGYLSNARYETFQHEAAARFVGLSDAQIAGIEAGDISALGEDEAAVMLFVEDMVRNVRAGDVTLAAVRRHLDDTQLTDLILVTGYYMMISRLLETTGVELDDAAIDWHGMAKTG